MPIERNPAYLTCPNPPWLSQPARSPLPPAHQAVILCSRKRTHTSHRPFSRFSRGYPFGAQIPLRIGSHVGRQSAQSRPTLVPVKAVGTTSPALSGPIFSFLDVTFKSYAERIQAELTQLRAACARVVSHNRQERDKWRAHCLSFKKERDVARERVRAMLKERECLRSVEAEKMFQNDQGQSREQDPRGDQGDNFPVVLLSGSGQHEHAVQCSTISVPTSPPAAADLATFASSPDSEFEETGVQSLLYHPIIKSPSLDPTTPVERTRSASPVFCSSRVSNKLDNEAGRVPPRRYSDGDIVDIANPPILFSSPPTVDRQKSSSSTESLLDPISSAAFSGQDVKESPPEPHSSPLHTSTSIVHLDTQAVHLDIMYVLDDGHFDCRVCLLLQSKLSPGLSPVMTSFPKYAKWEELRDHCLKDHPQECADIARLQPEELFELRRRIFCGTRS